jgi:hypothetical protein
MSGIWLPSVISRGYNNKNPSFATQKKYGSNRDVDEWDCDPLHHNGSTPVNSLKKCSEALTLMKISLIYCISIFKAITFLRFHCTSATIPPAATKILLVFMGRRDPFICMNTILSCLSGIKIAKLFNINRFLVSIRNQPVQ